ncbi:MAG: hypothetical protein AAF492_19265, partial [Verrucomicrobiota bacterium]
MIKASDIASFLEVEQVGPDLSIGGVSTLSDPQPQTVVFVGRLLKDGVPDSGSLYLVLPAQPAGSSGANAYLHVHNPRLALARVIENFFRIHPEPGIASTAHISPDVKMGTDCFVADQVVIQGDVELGAGVQVGANAIIHGPCRIGDGVIIGEGC